MGVELFPCFLSAKAQLPLPISAFKMRSRRVVLVELASPAVAVERAGVVPSMYMQAPRRPSPRYILITTKPLVVRAVPAQLVALAVVAVVLAEVVEGMRLRRVHVLDLVEVAVAIAVGPEVVL